MSRLPRFRAAAAAVVVALAGTAFVASAQQSVRPEVGNPLKAAYARNCLLARRLLEQGVRYVNLYCASRASGVAPNTE